MSRLGVLRSVFTTIWSDPSNKGQRVERLAISMLWQLYKRLARMPLIVTLDNGARFVADPAAGHSAGVFYTRIYESTFVSILRRHGDRKALVCDVGAHSGLMTLLVSDQFAGGFCIEPASDAFALLEANLALNKLSQYRAVRAACSSKAGGTATLVADGPHSGTAHVATGDERPHLRAEAVNVTSVDALFANESRPLGLLKIDTEGFELEVLRGAVETLRKNPGALIMYERNGDIYREINAMLSGLGFRLFTLDERGHLTDSPDAFPTAYNIFAAGPAHALSAERMPSIVAS
jgi:FkbM family methyltransferase